MTDTLLRSVAEQLKTPLVQINQLAELSEPTSLQSIAVLSTQALRAVDAYLLVRGQVSFELEPVSLGAVLYDVAHELSPLAAEHNRDIQIDVRGRAVPVMAHKQSLQALLGLLGEVVLQLPSFDSNSPDRGYVTLGVHRSHGGVVAGAFSTETIRFSPAMVRTLTGRAAQTSPTTGPQGGASLAVADILATRLDTVLKPYRHASLSGLGARMTPSTQLRLVP